MDQKLTVSVHKVQSEQDQWPYVVNVIRVGDHHWIQGNQIKNSVNQWLNNNHIKYWHSSWCWCFSNEKDLQWFLLKWT